MSCFPKRWVPITASAKDAFPFTVRLLSECRDSELFNQISEYVLKKDEDDVFGLYLALKTFDSVLKPEVVFKAWNNHNKSEESFRIDMFIRDTPVKRIASGAEDAIGGSIMSFYKDLKEYSLELALLDPTGYKEVRAEFEKKGKNFLDFVYRNSDPNPESVMLGMNSVKFKTFDLCMEYMTKDKIYTITAAPLFYKYGYNFED